MPNSNTNPPVIISARPFNFGSFPVTSTTIGTDTAGTSTTLFYASVWVPGNCAITGIKYLIGSVGGTDNVTLSLHDLNGNLLTKTAATLVGTTATTQSVPFTGGAYNFTGPGHVLIGLILSGATARFRSIPAVFDAGSNPMTGIVTVVANTPASFQPSLTTFTADKGAFASLY